MNKKVAAAIFLTLTLLITLTLGSYNFYVSNAEATMPIFVQQYEGFNGAKPTPGQKQHKENFAGDNSKTAPAKKSITTGVKK